MKKLIFTLAVCLFALNGMAQKKDWAGFGRFAKENAQVAVRPDAVFMGNSITEGWAYQDPEFFKQNNKSVKMVDCPYFTTNVIALEGEKEFDYASLDSFVLYICTEGEAEVKMGEHCEKLTPYELVMIPAEADAVTLSGNATLLEVYIK